MKKQGVDGIINNTDEIEIRCVGTYKDRHGKKWPCTHMFFVGSPGFDIHGSPKTQTVKCPKCKNLITVTCRIKEEVIVRVKEED